MTNSPNEQTPGAQTSGKNSKRDVYRLGNSFIFPPHVIDDIHIKAELGRYRMRGFSLFKKIPTWDDLTFLPGTLTRFVIEGYRERCDRRREHEEDRRRSQALELRQPRAEREEVDPVSGKLILQAGN